MAMQVQGRVHMQGGVAYLALAAAPAVMPRPSADEVFLMVSRGELCVHASKANITKREMNTQLCNVQRELKLRTGVNGQWSQQAWDKLTNWLMQVKRVRGGAGPAVLALPAPPVPPAPPAPELPALPEPQLLALGDQEDRDHDVSSASDTDSSDTSDDSDGVEVKKGSQEGGGDDEGEKFEEMSVEDHKSIVGSW